MPVSNILELHRKTRNNIGDYMCNPSRYFFFENCSTEKLTNNDVISSIDSDTNVVIGGGGLLHKKYSSIIEDVISKSPKTITLWGIGSNYSLKADPKCNPEWFSKIDLIGLRDFNSSLYSSNIHYVPCSSCLHKAFSRNYKVKYPKVYYLHNSETKFNRDNRSVPVMYNSTKNFNGVISFLGSGETVVTDSYHGVYWAMLLGKNVQTIPWSTKFYTLKYTPVFIDDINNPTDETCFVPSTYKAECQELNRKFYERFKNLCRF